MPDLFPKYSKYINIDGSNKAQIIAPTMIAIDLSEVIEITVLLKGNKPAITDKQATIRLTHEEYERDYAFTDYSTEIIRDFSSYFNLNIIAVNKPENTIILSGRIANLGRAFKTTLRQYVDEKGRIYRGREGYVQIPVELAGVVTGVYGLDNRPNAEPHIRIGSHFGTFAPSKRNRGYFPIEVAKLYNFPTNADGAGQCIGIIALGGGYRMTDLNKYFAGQGLSTPDISCVCINGAENSPSVPNSDDKEVLLDIQVAGSVAQGAKIVVYFAPNNDKGFLDAVNKAIHDKKNKPTIISISWGSPEKKWTRQSLKAFNEAFRTAGMLGITICVATGDAGSSDGVFDGNVHVDFPASSPFVLACGGTNLIAKNGKIISECVWHESDHAAGGGGVSEVFPLPEYQMQAKIPLSINPSKFKGRGVPDVAGNAAYANGYRILVNGYWMILGGTSAVAPLYAGLLALLNQIKGTTLGFVNPYLYDNPAFFREIIKGNNITARPHLGYTAYPGWNACAGLGVIESFNNA